MNKQTHLQVQVVDLRRLLEGAQDDPILAPQLRERLHDLEEELRKAQQRQGELLPRNTVELPRAAIFLRGAGVEDSEGIRPSLAGDALIQYEKMFIEQALHDEREAAHRAGRQRRRRGTPYPALLFTGTPRGSFGLEFVPRITDEDAQVDLYAQSLRKVADALTSVAESDHKSLDEAIKKIPSRILQPLKQFMKTLAEHDAEIRLAFPQGPSRSLGADKVKKAAERLEKEVTQETIKQYGVFRGVTRESGVFDLRLDSDEVITGTVADDLAEDDLERIDQLTNKHCVADLQKTTVIKIPGPATSTYVLLDAYEPKN